METKPILTYTASKPQSETAFCGQSQHNIKVEQIVKCIWGVWFTQIYFSTACVHLEQSDTLHYHVFSNLFNMAIRPYFPFIPINTFLWCDVYWCFLLSTFQRSVSVWAACTAPYFFHSNEIWLRVGVALSSAFNPLFMVSQLQLHINTKQTS